ncbi:MAG: O-antigen ligase family protein [Mucilaginibacter sp.]
MVTIAAATVLCVEVVFYTHLQTITGFSEYNYYFFNFESSGSYGLTTTFESDGGYKRFASFFSTPIEHGTAAMLALCIIAALYTTDKNKISINTIGLLATGASLMSVFFAFSRAPLAGYFIVIYVYSLITKRKFITNSIHAIGVVALLYLTYLFTGLGDSKHGIIEIIMNTIDFSDPSSVGHLVQWVEGIVSMIEKPFGLGLGSSGRVAGTLGENVGGENQFIVIGVQAGIVALLLYLSVYIMLIRTSLRWLPELKGRERKICMIVLLFKIGLLLPLLTTEIEASVYISYITWFLSGLFISIIMKSNQLALQPSYD